MCGLDRDPYVETMHRTLTDRERGYLVDHRLGRLATIGPDGGPDVVPVGYQFNVDGTIDIGGPRLGSSRKFRNVIARPLVALVVDDTVPEGSGPFRTGVGRGVEVRGRAEGLRGVPPPEFGAGHFTDEVIRLHPDWVMSWHVDPEGPSLSILKGTESRYRR